MKPKNDKYKTFGKTHCKTTVTMELSPVPFFTSEKFSFLLNVHPEREIIFIFFLSTINLLP
jgi:hypothetical protein